MTGGLRCRRKRVLSSRGESSRQQELDRQKATATRKKKEGKCKQDDPNSSSSKKKVSKPKTVTPKTVSNKKTTKQAATTNLDEYYSDNDSDATCSQNSDSAVAPTPTKEERNDGSDVAGSTPHPKKRKRHKKKESSLNSDLDPTKKKQKPSTGSASKLEPESEEESSEAHGSDHDEVPDEFMTLELPVVIRVSTWDVASRQPPKFKDRRILQDVTDTDGWLINSDLKTDATIDEVLQEIQSNFLEELDLDLAPKNNRKGSQLFSRKNRLKQKDSYNGSSEVAVMWTDNHLKKAIQRSSFVEFDEEDDDMPDAFYLDLLVIVAKRLKRHKKSSESTARSREEAKQERQKKTTIQAFLLGPVESVSDNGVTQYQAGSKDTVKLFTMTPHNDERISWKQLYYKAINLACEDPRYQDKEKRPILGEHSQMFFQQHKNRLVVAKLESTTKLWEVVEQRRGTVSNTDCVIYIAFGKKRPDDDTFVPTWNPADDRLPNWKMGNPVSADTRRFQANLILSQDAHAMNEPATKQKDPSKAEYARLQTKQIPARVNNWLAKLMEEEYMDEDEEIENPYYRLLAHEHFTQFTYELQATDFQKDGESSRVLVDEMYPLVKDDEDTWPPESLLGKLHPDCINIDEFNGLKTERGKYKIGDSNWPIRVEPPNKKGDVANALVGHTEALQTHWDNEREMRKVEYNIHFALAYNHNFSAHTQCELSDDTTMETVVRNTEGYIGVTNVGQEVGDRFRKKEIELNWGIYRNAADGNPRFESVEERKRTLLDPLSYYRIYKQQEFKSMSTQKLFSSLKDENGKLKAGFDPLHIVRFGQRITKGKTTKDDIVGI